MTPGPRRHGGATRRKAEDKNQELQDLIDPEVGVALSRLFFDDRVNGIDGLVPVVAQSGEPSRSQLLSETARAEGSIPADQRIAGECLDFQVVGRRRTSSI